MSRPDPVPASHGPIFIVGTMRSGTTLMRLVLDSHENIAIPQETGIMRAINAQKFVPFWKWGDQAFKRLGLSDTELDEELRRFYGGLFTRYAQAHGKSRWGEKTPWHLWHMEQIDRIWPDAVFLGMVRHPGGNVNSYQESWGFSLSHSITQWQRTNREMVRQAATLGNRFLLCRYEDLVLRPEQTLRSVLGWLGEPWSDRVLEHQSVQKQQGAPAVVEGQTRSDDAIDTSRVTKWQSRMGAGDQRRLRKRTEDLARFFGYSFDSVDDLAPLAAPGREAHPLANGDDIRDRLAGFADTEDLRVPPPVPAVEQELRPGRLTVTVKDKGPAAGDRRRGD